MDRYNEYEESNKSHGYYKDHDIQEKSNNSLILGIIAIVFTLIPFFKLIGIILGILAIVKGYKYRSENSSALAGWVLGILSLIFSSVSLLFIMFLFGHLFWLSNVFMGPGMMWI
ncbi:MAG: hypothetical protein JJE21_09635 [Spirochaetaceae bacterium]|nr:hypothetical protein [Spirochaetaceae bacterium]